MIREENIFEEIYRRGMGDAFDLLLNGFSFSLSSKERFLMKQRGGGEIN